MPETASRVKWPPNFERRPSQERSRNNNYDVTLARVFDDLEAELERDEGPPEIQDKIVYDDAE